MDPVPSFLRARKDPLRDLSRLDRQSGGLNNDLYEEFEIGPQSEYLIVGVTPATMSVCGCQMPAVRTDVIVKASRVSVVMGPS